MRGCEEGKDSGKGEPQYNLSADETQLKLTGKADCDKIKFIYSRED